MRYDEDKIAKILDSIKEEDLDYSPRTWIMWSRLFLSQLEHVDDYVIESFGEYKKKCRAFENSDLSEESFRRIYSEYKHYHKYMHPNEIDPDLKTINLETKQRVSLELTEVVKDLTYTQIFAFVDDFFDRKNISEWTPKYCRRELSKKYPRLRNHFIGDEIKKDKIS